MEIFKAELLIEKIKNVCSRGVLLGNILLYFLTLETESILTIFKTFNNENLHTFIIVNTLEKKIGFI